MSVVTGLGGVVSGQATVRNFRVTNTREAKAWSASGAAGMKSQLPGNKDWNGSFSIFNYIPGVLPGEGFTFTGQVDGVGEKWTGTAIVDGMTVSCNTEAADPLSCDVTFSANGALSDGTGAITDATAPTVFSSIGLGADWSGSAVSDVVSWTFGFTSDNQAYVSSSTAGQTLRKPGNLSGTASVTVLQSDASAVIVPGTVAVLKLYVTGSLFWEFNRMELVSTETGADIEGGAINRVTYNFAYTGWWNNAGTWTQGSVVKPDTADYWP